MNFSENLRLQADPIFETICNHPFVQDIAYERLSPAAIVHYVQQDTQYLNTYAKVYALALAKSQTREQMQLFQARIEIVLNGELMPHLNLCRAAGVELETLQQPVAMAPTAHHYARQMLTAAYTGSFGEIVAAVLPCHWTYVDLARKVAEQIHIYEQPNHLFYDWITFYASDDMHTSLQELTTLLNACAEHSSASERDAMEAVFIDGCRLEDRFFTMAYTQETW